MGQSDCPVVVGKSVVAPDGSATVGMVLAPEKMMLAGQDRRRGVLWAKVTANGQKRCGRVMFDERVWKAVFI